MKPTTYADITPLEPEWEIPNLVPKSFVTLIIGDGGVGKHNATAGENFLVYTPTHIESEHDIPTAWQIVACVEDCEEKE